MAAFKSISMKSACQNGRQERRLGAILTDESSSPVNWAFSVTDIANQPRLYSIDDHGPTYLPWLNGETGEQSSI